MYLEGEGVIDLANVEDFSSALSEIGSVLRFASFAVIFKFKVVGHIPASRWGGGDDS